MFPAMVRESGFRFAPLERGGMLKVGAYKRFVPTGRGTSQTILLSLLACFADYADQQTAIPLRNRRNLRIPILIRRSKPMFLLAQAAISGRLSIIQLMLYRLEGLQKSED